MYKLLHFLLFICMAINSYAEPFLGITPGKLNFEKYPVISTTCIIENFGSYKMTAASIKKFNFSIVENGFYIQDVSYQLMEIIDKDNSIVEISYTSMSPLYTHRDITFHVTAENYSNGYGENFIFTANKELYNDRMNPIRIPPKLLKYETKIEQNTKQPDIHLLSDKSLFECSNKELWILRNHYFAEKGYIFKNKELNTYFNSQNWYAPTTNDVKSLKLTDLEKAEIAYIKYHENLKSKSIDLEITNIEFDPREMITKMTYRQKHLYPSAGYEGDDFDIYSNFNNTFISFQTNRQPLMIAYRNKYFRYERIRSYHDNGYIKRELLIQTRPYDDTYHPYEHEYDVDGGMIEINKTEEHSYHFLSLEDLTKYKFEWIESEEYQYEEENDFIKYYTVYDLKQFTTPSQTEINRLIRDSLETNKNDEYDFDELKSIYELNYPKSKILELNLGNYIKEKGGKYLHNPDIYNHSNVTVLLEEHSVSLVYVSLKNKVYNQNLYNKDPIDCKNGWTYDDNYVWETEGDYKINDWDAGEEQLMDIFHPDMEHGTYIIFMKIYFPEHKKTLYSEKYKLEYVPITNEEVEEFEING